MGFRPRSLLSFFGGMILGGASGSIAWSLAEAFRVHGEGVSFIRAWMATGAAAACVCFAVTLVIAVVAAVATCPLGVRFVPRAPRLSTLIVAAAVFLASNLSVWGAHILFDAVFAGRGVKAIALAFAAPVVTFVLIGLGHAILGRRRRGEHGERVSLASTRVTLSVILISVVVWMFGFRLLEGDVFEALGISGCWPVALTLGLSLIGIMFIEAGKKISIFAIASAGLLVVLGVAHLVVETPDALSTRVRTRTDGARIIYGLFAGEPPSFKRPLQDAQTCFIGKKMPSPKGLGRVKKNAWDIILFTVDALRWDHTSLSGYARDTTPKLAEWAKKGVVFEQASTPSNSTRQTFRALFTGLYPSQVETPPPVDGKWGLSLAEDQVTLASYLAAAGYETVAIISAMTIFQDRDHGLNGFTKIDRTPVYVRQKLKFSSSYQVDRIIAHLSTYRPGRPRFVWAHIMDTHQPYHKGPNARVFGKSKMDRYDASIRAVDGEIDRLLQFALGPSRRDRTIVMLAADHGQGFDEHGTKLHGHSAHQEEIHVPLIIWGPGIVGRRVSGPVSMHDIFPTAIDVAGLPPIDALCGRSLLPAMLRGEDPAPRPVYMESIPDYKINGSSFAFEKGKLKLVARPDLDSIKMYDVIADPFEKRDLYSSDVASAKNMIRSLKEYCAERGLWLCTQTLER